MLFWMTWQLIKSSISTIRKFKQHRGIFETFTTALVVILPVLQWQTEKGKIITPLTTLHASRHGTKSYSTHNFGSTAVTQIFQASPFLLTDTHTDTKKKGTHKVCITTKPWISPTRLSLHITQWTGVGASGSLGSLQTQAVLWFSEV